MECSETFPNRKLRFLVDWPCLRSLRRTISICLWAGKENEGGWLMKIRDLLWHAKRRRRIYRRTLILNGSMWAMKSYIHGARMQYDILEDVIQQSHSLRWASQSLERLPRDNNTKATYVGAMGFVRVEWLRGLVIELRIEELHTGSRDAKFAFAVSNQSMRTIEKQAH